jgi:hypothetical protein
MLKDFIEIQKKIFEKRIGTKTGWGKNEVMTQLLEATNEAMIEIVSKKEEIIPGGFGSSGSTKM